MVKIISIVFAVIQLNIMNAFGQVQVGAGVNIGKDNFGVEVQAYSPERLKGFIGGTLRKYDSFASRIGIGVSIRPYSKKHNFWINTSYEHKFASTPTLIRDDIYYTYRINNLNYWNIEGVYSFRIDKYFKEGSFLLLEAKLISKQLLNKVLVTPFESNSSVYINDEKRIRRFYFSGALINLGIKFVW